MDLECFFNVLTITISLCHWGCFGFIILSVQLFVVVIVICTFKYFPRIPSPQLPTHAVILKPFSSLSFSLCLTVHFSPLSLAKFTFFNLFSFIWKWTHPKKLKYFRLPTWFFLFLILLNVFILCVYSYLSS